MDKTALVDEIKNTITPIVDHNAGQINSVLTVIEYKDKEKIPSAILITPDNEPINSKKLTNTADTLLDTVKGLYGEITLMSIHEAFIMLNEEKKKEKEKTDTETLNELFDNLEEIKSSDADET